MSISSAAKWQRENPEKVREKSRRWRENHPARVKRVNAEQYKKNRKKILKQKKSVYRDDPGKQRKRSLKWQRDNPEKKRITVLKSLYGLNEDEYRNLLDKTRGVCPICKNGFDYKTHFICVDHDHLTGAVRGLICRRCNSGLGFFTDDPNIFMNAIKYLKNKGE